MANHYHLLLHTPRGNLSRCMRHINGVYTQRFNRSKGLDGQLFRGRFKSILVDGDNYLLQWVRYIHRNPVRAGVVDHPEEYPWSSHKGFLSSAKKWEWLHKDYILSILSADEGGRLRAYRGFMAEEDSEQIREVFERKKWPAFLGGEEFITWLKGRFFEQAGDSQVPESVALAPELERIKKVVCSYYQVEETELLKPRRGRLNEPRSVAIYLVRRLRKEGLKQISSVFGLRGYSAASSVLERMARQLMKDRGLQKRCEQIQKSLVKGQTET